MQYKNLISIYRLIQLFLLFLILKIKIFLPIFKITAIVKGNRNSHDYFRGRLHQLLKKRKKYLLLIF